MPLVREMYIIAFETCGMGYVLHRHLVHTWNGSTVLSALDVRTWARSTYIELMDRSESKGCHGIGLPQNPTSVLEQPSQIRKDEAVWHAVVGCAKH